MTLKDARELLGISQHRLDREAGLPKGSTWELETGANLQPSHEKVVRLVRALRRLGLAGADAEKLFPVTEPTGDEAKAS